MKYSILGSFSPHQSNKNFHIFFDLSYSAARSYGNDRVKFEHPKNDNNKPYPIMFMMFIIGMQLARISNESGRVVVAKFGLIFLKQGLNKFSASGLIELFIFLLPVACFFTLWLSGCSLNRKH